MRYHVVIDVRQQSLRKPEDCREKYNRNVGAYTIDFDRLLTYLLTPWSRVLLEKLTSKLCS
jgi:hypothetical protein